MNTWHAVSFGAWVLLVAACGGGAGVGSNLQPEHPSSLERVTPSRNLHLRAAFDNDPTVYVGRFIPEGVAAAELDENRASKTQCSEHFKVKVVSTNQEMDELVYASSQAAAAVGLITTGGVAGARGDSSGGSVLRVHYTITKKIQVDSDPNALAACCTKNPGACTNTVVGEFLMGSGEIYQEATNSSSASGELGVPPVSAKASYADASQWKKVQSFKDTFFAFLPVATGEVNSKAAVAAEDKAARVEASCDFCRALPEDSGGLYFCGVSSPAAEEAIGRDGAMTSARTQVVRYLGEQIQTRSQALSTTAKGLVSDERFTQAVAKGLATRVKDRKHCAEKQNTPDHLVVYKVLAFIPTDALAEAASKAVDEVVAAKGTNASAADAEAAKGAVKAATRK